MLKMTPNFALFDSLWKLREGWTRSLGFTYDQTSEIHLMAVQCVAAECGGLIK